MGRLGLKVEVLLGEEKKERYDVLREELNEVFLHGLTCKFSSLLGSCEGGGKSGETG